jgi:hypothetical protein
MPLYRTLLVRDIAYLRFYLGNLEIMGSSLNDKHIAEDVLLPLRT